MRIVRFPERSFFAKACFKCPFVATVVALLLLLLFSTHLGVVPAYSQQSQVKAATAHPQFAFWYETWKNAETYGKVANAGTIIGLSPADVSSVHQLGSRAFRYVTFYQARFGTTFLKDQTDLPNVGFLHDNEFLPSAFGGVNNYVLCADSKIVRDRAIAFVEQALQQEKFDGLFIDNTYVSPAAQDYCSSKTHYHVQPGARGDDAWLGLLAEVRAKVKQISPAALIVTNPGNPKLADQLGTGKYTLWDLSDYVLWESYGYTSDRGEHDRWQRTIASSFDLPESKRRKTLTLSYPLDRGEALYSFAVARIFGFEWTANLGESEATNGKSGGHFGSFLPDVPFELGAPQGSIEGNKESDHIARKFANGQAVANISNSPIKVSVPGNVRLYVGDSVTDSVRPTQVTLPARTAAVYIQKQR